MQHINPYETMSARRKLPPLNALKAFEAAARLGGFTAAGEELFVSPGAVSKHVANLESFLGVPLFKRRHNEVSLTPEGAVYLGKIGTAMDVIADASTCAVTESGPEKLHINAPPTFTERWLLPRLSGFIELHPQARIQVLTSLEATDWDTDRADIAVHAGIGAWIERGERLFDTEIVPVCSPRWFAENGSPNSPADILECHLVSSVNKTGDWLRWFHSTGLQPENATPYHFFGTSAMAYKATIEGLGPVCAERKFIDQDLATGRLQILFDKPVQGCSYFIEFRPDKTQGMLAKSFRTWMLSQINS